jgi:adenosylmethionine-8-amino-7-oxononanoate aminotransferase
MVGIQLVAEKETLKEYPVQSRTAHRVILEARKRGVIVRPLGDVIILMPPLSITEGELKTLLDVVYESIRLVTEG